MADARDLKSLGRNGRAGSSPAAPTIYGLHGSNFRQCLGGGSDPVSASGVGPGALSHRTKGLSVAEVTAETKILNKYGFHVRPSTQFMQKAREYTANITVQVDDVTADGKSIMQLMALGAMQDSTVKITADGPDADEAVTSLVQLIQSRFGGID